MDESTLDLILAPDYCDADEFHGAYRRAFERFFNIVLEMGFTAANCCYPMNVENSEGLQDDYGATANNRLASYAPAEKSLVFKALYDVLPAFRSKLRIFSPRTSLLSLSRVYNRTAKTPAMPCLGGLRHFFLDAKQGRTYPCGYRAHDEWGVFPDRQWKNRQADPDCLQCDWECFRDSSELLAPLIRSMGNSFF